MSKKAEKRFERTFGFKGRGNAYDPKVVVVGSMDGDEPFGTKFYHLGLDPIPPEVLMIVANPEAIVRGVKFIDEDMDCCFPGNPNGEHEQLLAHRLLRLIRNVPYVINLHTTTSPGVKLTPITTSLSSSHTRVINLCDSAEVVMMSSAMAIGSLIGCVRCGVSLVLGAGYAKSEEAMADVDRIVRGLNNNSELPRLGRHIFPVSATIPTSTRLPEGVRNFDHVPDLGYVFLVGETSYTTHQGFLARKKAEDRI